MKILVSYDPATGGIIFDNGIAHATGLMNLKVEEIKSGDNLVLQLVKQGLSAADIIDLRKQDLI